MRHWLFCTDGVGRALSFMASAAAAFLCLALPSQVAICVRGDRSGAGPTVCKVGERPGRQAPDWAAIPRYCPSLRAATPSEARPHEGHDAIVVAGPRDDIRHMTFRQDRFLTGSEQ